MSALTNKQKTGLSLAVTLPGLIMLTSVAALGQDVSNTTTTESRSLPADTERTPLNESERARSNAWNLSETEWRRYQGLMLGIRGSVSTSHLSPIEVLGIHARDALERRAYAERWARAMRDDAERILAFQHAYDAAAKRLLSGQTLIDVGKLQHLPQKTSELKREDRVLFFTRAQCPACDAVLVKLLSRLESIAGIDIFLTDVPDNDDSVIRSWAESKGIDAEWVRSRQVTLNHDAGTLQKITDDAPEIPALFVRRNQQVSKLQYTAL
jgi:integrating conjugative element protein (TIGR03759 family)